MDKLLSEKIMGLALFIGMPCVALTTDDSRKWVRVLAFLLSLSILMPLLLFGLCIWMVGMLVFAYEEI